MGIGKLVEVPRRILDIGENGNVGSEDDFLGRSKRDTWQWNPAR